MAINISEKYDPDFLELLAEEASFPFGNEVPLFAADGRWTNKWLKTTETPHTPEVLMQRTGDIAHMAYKSFIAEANYYMQTFANLIAEIDNLNKEMGGSKVHSSFLADSRRDAINEVAYLKAVVDSIVPAHLVRDGLRVPSWSFMVDHMYMLGLDKPICEMADYCNLLLSPLKNNFATGNVSKLMSLYAHYIDSVIELFTNMRMSKGPLFSEESKRLVAIYLDVRSIAGDAGINIKPLSELKPNAGQLLSSSGILSVTAIRQLWAHMRKCISNAQKATMRDVEDVRTEEQRVNRVRQTGRL